MPSEVLAALGLDQCEPGERLLAWSLLAGGGAAAATTLRMRVSTPRGQRIARAWLEVDQAVWDQDSRTLLVRWIDRRTTALEIVDDVGRLPEVVRERVQSSVVATSSVPLPGRPAARVALRRGPDGRLSLQTLLPPGVRESDPAVVGRLEAAGAALWADAGEQGLNQPL